MEKSRWSCARAARAGPKEGEYPLWAEKRILPGLPILCADSLPRAKHQQVYIRAYAEKAWANKKTALDLKHIAA
jgi:hypothetical protein